MAVVSGRKRIEWLNNIFLQEIFIKNCERKNSFSLKSHK